jgi:hypothetical protein
MSLFPARFFIAGVAPSRLLPLTHVLIQAASSPSARAGVTEEAIPTPPSKTGNDKIAFIDRVPPKRSALSFASSGAPWRQRFNLAYAPPHCLSVLLKIKCENGALAPLQRCDARERLAAGFEPAQKRSNRGRTPLAFELGSPRRGSKEPNVGRRLVKPVMPAIDIADRRRRQFIGVDVVEQVDLNCVESPAQRFHFAAPGRSNAASFAKMKLNGRRRPPRRNPLIIRLGLCAPNKTKAIGSHDGEPGARLGATRTIAFECSLGDVEIGFKANGAAMAAAGIGSQGHVGALSLVVETGFDEGCAPITQPERREIRAHARGQNQTLVACLAGRPWRSAGLAACPGEAAGLRPTYAVPR